MPPSPQSAPTELIFGVATCLVLELTIILASAWRIFEKSGEDGWKAIVPVENLIVGLRIAGKPRWWVLFLFVPLVNLFFWIFAVLGLARRFNKSDLFGIGMLAMPYLFFPILAFGKSEPGPLMYVRSPVKS